LHKILKALTFIFIILICSVIFFTGCRDSSIGPEDMAVASASTGNISDSKPTDSTNQTTVSSSTAKSTESAADSSTTVKSDQSFNASLEGNNPDAKLQEVDDSLNLKGKVLIDGSAMMSPISDKIAEAFRKVYPQMEIDVSMSGTNEGIVAFISGKTDICSTSRAFTDSEASDAKTHNLDFIQLKVAYDGIVIAVNKSNPVDSISLEEIRKIWMPDSTISNWNEVNSKWPDQDMMVYGPKSDTGLIDFFCNNILGTKNHEIGSYSETENDEELTKTIINDNTSIGIINFSNYFINKDKLKALKIDSGSGAVLPGIDTIKNGSYKILSSPMYLYVNKNSLSRKEVKAFVQYYLENASKIVMSAGYLPIEDSGYKSQEDNLK
jgi:phosphate transport system substrate-binding protein